MSAIIFKTATKLDPASLKQISAFAKTKTESALPAPTLDPTLLAGFILEVDGIEYDYSLSGSLSRLGKSL